MQQHVRQIVAAAATPSDPLQLLLQYGVLGVFAVLLVMYTRGTISREREKSDKTEAQVQELNDYIRQQLLPMQVEATVLHKQVAEVLEQAIQLITEMKIRNSIAQQHQQPSQQQPPPYGDGSRG